MKKVISYSLIVAIAITIVVLNVYDCMTSADSGEEKKMSEQEYFKSFELLSFEGEGFTNAMFCEGLVVVVNIWEPYCKSCINEMEALEKLYCNYKDKGLMVIGIEGNAYLYEDELELAYEEWESMNVSFPMLLADEGFTAEVLPSLKDTFPGTYILDESGKVLDFRHGAMCYEDWVRFVEPFLKEEF